MMFDCSDCGTPLFMAAATDNVPIVLEAQPVDEADGPYILFGQDLDSRPTAIYGGPKDIDWYRSLSGGDIEPTSETAPRYRRHQCKVKP